MRWIRPMACSTAATAVVMGIVLGACSGEDLAERVVENQLEAESGEDVDIDIDDGDFSVRTEEGEITFDADDDGGVSVSGSSEDGEFSIESDDGETVFESEDGSATVSSSGDVPEGFPSSVPLPSGLTILVSQAVDMDGEQNYIISGSVDDDAAQVARTYIDQLEAAGFEQIQLTETSGAVFFGCDDGEHYVGGAAAPDGSFTLNVGPTQQG